jgi:CRISPR-associated protein Csb2
MLTLGIRYLTGCVVASDIADRRRAEWPPHPGRVFMALAAAHFQTGGDSAEQTALEWLETETQRRPPHIHAPKHVERPVVTHYVPVNDEAGPSKTPLQSVAGLTRARQPRTFACAWLEDDTVYLVWRDAQPEAHFAPLERLCGKVTRIGHSSSLVQMWASQTPPEAAASWLPDDARATEHFRVPATGLLHYLRRQFNEQEVNEFFELSEVAGDTSDKERQKAAKSALRERFQNRPPARLRPELSVSQGYAPRRDEVEPLVPGTVFDPRLLVFALRRVDGPYRQLDLAATLQVTGRFREALLQHLGADPPETLSGQRGQARSERPHVAFLPLPFVGHEHADGGILGVALAVPRDIDAGDRQRLLKALNTLRGEGLNLGALGRWDLGSPDAGASPVALRDRLWTAAPAGARQWATVTPYVYDRHAKAKDKAAYQRELAEAVRESWQRVRQSPEVLVEVAITPVSAHLGAPASHQFPRLARKDGSECRHTHAILIFDRPVVGPVLLGAGRYRGYGLCRPLRGEG